MRQILLLFVFIVLSFICAALLSFPVYKLLHLFIDIRFHNITSQLSSFCGLIFIFLYLRCNNILNKTTAGFNLSKKIIKHEIFTGLTMGITIMLVLIVILMATGLRQTDPEFNSSYNAMFLLLTKAIISGVVVALIEETLYRGALLGGLSKTTNVLIAVVTSSLIYSAVHFINFSQVPANADINWITGFIILSGSFNRFVDPAIIDYFLVLFAFGVLLAQVRLNKGNIFQCMGMHAGVIIAIKVIKELTDYAPGSNFGFLVSREDHLLGYMALAWLVAINVVYFRCFFTGRDRSKP